MKITDLQQKEFSYFYGAYLKTLGKNEDIMSALIHGKEWFQTFINNIDEEQLAYRYEDGKWTIAEVLVHLIDTERIFQYRAFRISRNDKTPLPGFDQDAYIQESAIDQYTKEDILNEYLSVRDASINLFKTMSNEKLLRFGTASTMPWSVAAIGLTISGHQKHHEIILADRYRIN